MVYQESTKPGCSTRWGIRPGGPCSSCCGGRAAPGGRDRPAPPGQPAGRVTAPARAEGGGPRAGPAGGDQAPVPRRRREGLSALRAYLESYWDVALAAFEGRRSARPRRGGRTRHEHAGTDPRERHGGAPGRRGPSRSSRRSSTPGGRSRPTRGPGRPVRGGGVKAERVEFEGQVGGRVIEHLSDGQALPGGRCSSGSRAGFSCWPGSRTRANTRPPSWKCGSRQRQTGRWWSWSTVAGSASARSPRGGGEGQLTAGTGSGILGRFGKAADREVA